MARLTVHAVLYFFVRVFVHPKGNDELIFNYYSCHFVPRGDTLAMPYFSAVLRVWNVTAFSIQLYWRAWPRAGSFISRKLFLNLNFENEK